MLLITCYFHFAALSYRVVETSSTSKSKKKHRADGFKWPGRRIPGHVLYASCKIRNCVERGGKKRKNTTEAQRHLEETPAVLRALHNWDLPSQGLARSCKALLMAYFIPSGRNTRSCFKVAVSFRQQRGQGMKGISPTQER